MSEKIVEATAESILGLRGKVPIEKYEIRDAGIVYIHGFTGVEKAQWLNETRDNKGKINPELVEPQMFLMCVRNKAGKRLYKHADIPKLKMLPAAVLGSVTDVCMKLSGMSSLSDDVILKNLEGEDEEADTNAS